MSILVRKLRRDETRAFLEVHHAAVRGIAAADYPRDTIDAWAPLPITDGDAQEALANFDAEIRLAALMESRLVGIGVVIPQHCELRACYVSPRVARNGLGSALVAAMEQIAREHQSAFLELDSSLTAEPFHLRCGYTSLERGSHELRSGHTMACIKMRKRL